MLATRRVRVGGMSANGAFLTRLSRIVDQAASDAARAAGAVALVDAYRRNLFGRLGIVASCRPTAWTKEAAKDELDDLWHEILKAEVGAPPGAARIYAAARQRIEMARRVLKLRIADDRTCERAASSGGDRHADCDAVQRDIRLIAAVRRRLCDRRVIVTSWEAIRQSRDLLARYAAPFFH
jgi:hypothetical protein